MRANDRRHIEGGARRRRPFNRRRDGRKHLTNTIGARGDRSAAPGAQRDGRAASCQWDFCGSKRGGDAEPRREATRGPPRAPARRPAPRAARDTGRRLRRIAGTGPALALWAGRRVAAAGRCHVERLCGWRVHLSGWRPDDAAAADAGPRREPMRPRAGAPGRRQRVPAGPASRRASHDVRRALGNHPGGASRRHGVRPDRRALAARGEPGKAPRHGSPRLRARALGRSDGALLVALAERGQHRGRVPACRPEILLNIASARRDGASPSSVARRLRRNVRYTTKRGRCFRVVRRVRDALVSAGGRYRGAIVVG